MTDPPAVACAVLERNRYLTLATADRAGCPWSSPVWFASRDHRTFGDAELRLYRAEATEVSVLGTTPGGRDERVPVDLAVAP